MWPRANFDEWPAPNRRPDGSAHKFDVAYKDHPRRDYIGLQDHGTPCWYKNLKLLPLGQDTMKEPEERASREKSANACK